MTLSNKALKYLVLIPFIALQHTPSITAEHSQLIASSLILSQFSSEKLDEISDNLDQHTELKILIPADPNLNEEGRNKLNWERQADIYGLAAALTKNRTITTLTIHNFPLGDYGAGKIGWALHQGACITSLDLGFKDIGDAGMSGLSEALSSKQCLITYLNLSNNKITKTGTNTLKETLKKNTSLKTLDLSNNQLRNYGAMHLGHMLFENDSLEELLLNGNSITLEGLDMLRIGIKYNQGLKKIDLKNNPIRHKKTEFEDFEEILNGLKENTKNRDFVFDYDQ